MGAWSDRSTVSTARRSARRSVIWPVDHYFDEGPRVTDWLVKGVVKQHRTAGTYLNMLVRAGFAISRVEDWSPTDEQIASRPEWAMERCRPLFLLVAADKVCQTSDATVATHA